MTNKKQIDNSEKNASYSDKISAATPDKSLDSEEKSGGHVFKSPDNKPLKTGYNTITNKNKESKVLHERKRSKTFSIALAIIPLVVLAGMIFFLTSPYGQNLITSGKPLPEITIEKIEFHDNQIVAFIRNTGPEQVTISQADVNDRIQSAAIEPSKVISRLGEAKVTIPFLWNPAEPYEIGITTSDGTRFSNTVDAAAPAPIPNTNQITIFAILGIFVGVVPVLIGLAWYPFMRKITTNQYNFFLSLTAGLLVFLGIDAILESNEIAANNLAKVFNGQILVPVVVISTFLGLYFLSEYFIKRAEYKSSQIPEYSSKSKKTSSNSADSEQKTKDSTPANLYKSEPKYSRNIVKSTPDQNNPQVIQSIKNKEIIKPLAISLMVAIGIGFHNFGEGLAIGAAVLLGEIALSTFLIIGFTIHNTTEGLAIVAPLAKTGRLMIKRLIMMGLIAGVPTIVGTWIGGFVYSPLASVVFLSIGAGAIFQVVYSLITWMSKSFKSNEQKEILTIEEDGTSKKEITNSNIKTENASNSGISIVVGFIVGMLIMYFTGLFV